MKKKTRILTCLLVVLLLVTAILPTSVFADSTTTITKSNAINSDYYYWGGQMVQYTFTYYDGTTITTNHGGFALHYAGANLTSIVGAQVAYCIEPDTGSTTGTTYNGTAAENSSYWNNKLSPAQRTAIKLILLYGAPNSLYSTDAKTLFGYEGATQILIWEIVMGLRSPTYPYTLNDSRLKNNFYSNPTFPSTKTGYDTIVAKMQAHLDIPSFASHFLNSAQTFTLDYDSASGLYKKSLTDTNGVLSKDYNFSAPGVTFSKSGNTLNISAPASAFSGGEVTASATGSSLSLSSLTQMIWTLPGKQTVTTFQASPDPVPCYFKMKIDGGTATIKKTSDNGDVSGYCFKIYKWTDNLSWYGKSDSSGNVYVTNSSYAASGTKNYIFTGLNDGTYTFLEVLSEKGKDLVFPDSWTITVKRGGSTVFNKTYTAADLTRDSNGDCRLNKIAITGLNGGGVLSMTIHNAPETGDLEIVKTSTDGKIKDISFKVEQYEAEGGIGWWEMGTYKTNSSGKITVPGLPVGTKLRITEIVPAGYECTSDNPQTITLKRGTNTVTFTNKPTTSTCEIIKQSDDGNIKGITFTVKDSKGKVVFTGKTDKNGKISVPGLTIGETYTVIETVPENYVSDNREQTIKIKEGTNSLTFVNHPTSRLELIKTSDDGNVKNISFTVEEYEPEGGIGWWTRGTYKTDAAGKIDLELKYGYKYRVTETVPEDYVSENRVQEFTAQLGTNTLTFINHPTSRLELIKTSDDGNVKDISFKIEEYEPEGGIGWWTRGTYKTDADGKINLELKYGYKYRVTETVPEDYVSENRVQEFTAQLGTNTLTFVNHPVAKLEIVKTSTDGKVSGISFKVEVQSSKKWTVLGTYTSDADGKILVEGLEVGKKLRITELVPENYICTSANPQTITLVKGMNSVSFTNKPIVTLELLKTSDDGKVDGIEFTLEQKLGDDYSVIGTYVTDADGKITVEDLTEGAVYRLTETVPEGYIGETLVQEFTAQLGTNAVSFSNRLIRGDLRIVKVDKATQTPLEGAGYRVFNAAGEVVAEGYTDENGEVSFENLAYGEYTYQEFVAPEGFVLDETVYGFSIIQDGVEVAKEHDNQPKEGSITIYKVDESGRPLPGVTFLLEFSIDGGKTWSPIQYREATDDVRAGYCTSEGLDQGRLVTGEDGYAVFTGLCIDTQLGEVLYRVTETATKNGYSLLPGYAFNDSLSENTDIEVSFTVVNQPEFKMPATGGSGFTGMVIALAFAGLAAAAMLPMMKKRRETE